MLLVYCALIRNETLAAQGTHIPLWGLVGAVGAVIVGSGIYSAFLSPSEEPAVPTPDGFVLVPRAEWEDARLGMRPIPRPASRPPAPPWWEGPHDYPEPADARPTAPTVHREAPRQSTVPSPRAARPPPPIDPSAQRLTVGDLGSKSKSQPPIHPGPTTGPAPPNPRSVSLRELKESLSELEALVSGELKPTVEHLLKARPPVGAPSCADCGRAVSRDPNPSQCSDCSKVLCLDCALSSQFEDADLLCNECRGRRL